MSDLFYLTTEQLERIRPFFPLSHGVARVDDCKVISGIIYVIRNGLMWKDAPAEYGPHKTLYDLYAGVICEFSAKYSLNRLLRLNMMGA